MKEETKRWVLQSEKDLKAAKINLDNSLLDVAVFMAQQSVEKIFKAILIETKGQFPRIHDLVSLARRIGAPDKVIVCCSKINPAYTATRYPDELSIDFKEDEADNILKCAEDVLKWAKAKIR